VPARFSVLAGMALAVLSGYGAARLLERWPRLRHALTGVMLTLVVVEALPNLRLEHVWPKPPAIYDTFLGSRPAVLAEFPMPGDIGSSWSDARYLYFSTFHWQTLVNGYSGFMPASYEELLWRERDFPSDSAIEYLETRGVEYLAIHGAFYRGPRYGEIVSMLDARPDLEFVIAAPWQGRESRLYRFRSVTDR
jgi:hypothetical protein